MNQEILGVLAALATIGGFLLEVVEVLYRVRKRWNARRMARKGTGTEVPENE